MKNKWEDVTLNDYKQIVEINKSKEGYDKIVALVAVLNEMTEKEVWDLPIAEMAKLTPQLEFINEFNNLKKHKFNTIKIGDKWELKCDINMKEFTVAQYMDFQNYWQEPQKDLAKLISVFYLPKGKKYADGYDVEELINDLNNSLNIVEANEIAFFLLRKLQQSTKVTQIYLGLLTKMLAWKMRKMKKTK